MHKHKHNHQFSNKSIMQNHLFSETMFVSGKALHAEVLRLFKTIMIHTQKKTIHTSNLVYQTIFLYRYTKFNISNEHILIIAQFHELDELTRFLSTLNEKKTIPLCKKSIQSFASTFATFTPDVSGRSLCSRGTLARP